MKQIKQVPVERLKRWVETEQFKFKTTNDLEPYTHIIGQDRAVKAFKFGLAVDKPSYNIYVAGWTGTGKLTYSKNLLKHIATTKTIPNDWVYVYNFVKPSQPKALQLPPGMGTIFQQDMEEFVANLKEQMPKVFDSEEFERQKVGLQEEFQSISDQLMTQLSEMAESMGFILKKTSTGFMSLPLKDGETLSEEQFDNLSEEERNEFDEKTIVLQQKANEITVKIRRLERQVKEKEVQLTEDSALYVVGDLMEDLRQKYQDFQDIIDYLAGVQADILENIEDFMPQDEEEVNPMAIFTKSRKKDPGESYQVNIIRDSLEFEGAPVVFEPNPTYNNLVGRIEYENEMGSFSTDLTRIKGGALHKANGGYLILQVKDLMTNSNAWQALKRVLKNGEIKIEPPSEQTGTVITSIQPEPIPVSVKVILIGSAEIYSILYQQDTDFGKLFKILAEFDDEMEYNSDNIALMTKFVAGRCREDNLLPFDRSGVGKIIEHCSYLAENQHKLTTRFNSVVEILHEADAWARLDEAKLIDAKYVDKAIRERLDRASLVEEKLGEMIEEDHIMVDVTGEKVGQVNGLTILDLGEYYFGKPCRITVETFIGEEGVVNIEREVRMSGRIHDKGVLILQGYLGSKYAQEFPLCLTATICFEQLYDGVDGDSASSTELYGLLSSLSGYPIKQSLAVTGSVNQKGQIQPVGGVTQKIEGFFKTCQAKGLTGEQGVIIPYQNVDNLVLGDEVIEAVKNKQFSIYPITSIEEGIEILLGVQFKKIDLAVRKRLKYFSDALNNDNE